MPHEPDPLDEAVALHDRALACLEDGGLVDASALARRAAELFEANDGADHPDVANVLLTLARIEERRGHFGEARDIARRAAEAMETWSGHDEPYLTRLRIQARTARANLDRVCGDLDVAYASLTDTLALAEAAFGPNDPDVATVLNTIGMVCKYAARFDEGEAAYRRALDIFSAQPDPDPGALTALYHNLGGLEHARGRPGPGIAWAERGLALREKTAGADHPDTAADIGALGALYEQAGRLSDAEAGYRRALAIFEAALGPDHYEVGVVWSNLGSVLADQEGRATEAEAAYRRGLALKEAALGADHPDVALTLQNLGVLLAGEGRTDDARTLLRRAETIVSGCYPAGHPRVSSIAQAVASLTQPLTG